VGVEPPSPSDIAQTILLEVLPALGAIDVGEAEHDEQQGASPLVRITPRGRSLFRGKAPAFDITMTGFVDETVLRIGSDATVGAIVSVFPFCGVGRVDSLLELEVSNASISRAVAAGFEGGINRTAISGLAAPTPAIARMLDQLSVVLGRVSYVSAGGFLWCDDADVREMLRSRRLSADLFLDPSPPGGLLVAPGATMDMLTRRCRALGVEVTEDGHLMRARSSAPPEAIEDVGSPGPTRRGKKTERSAGSRPRKATGSRRQG